MASATAGQDAARILRSSSLKLSAFALALAQASYPRLILSGHNFQTDFRGSMQTPPTRFPRLQTFISSGPRVPLPGWWLTFTHGRIRTSWMTTTDFIEGATLDSLQSRI